MPRKRPTPNAAIDLADRIRTIRKHFGLTQAEFAQRIGVSRSYLSEVESKKGKPSLEMILGIATKFGGIRPEWLLTGRGGMIPGLGTALFYFERGELIFELAYELAGRATEGRSQTIPPKIFSKIMVLLMQVMDDAYAAARLEQGGRGDSDTIQRAIEAGQKMLGSPEVRALIGIE